MACVCRMFNLISKDVSVRKQALRILKPSVSTIYGAARETRQPVRTWMLHTWYTWIHCELSVAADPKSVLTKYHEPTVALIHAHILCDTATGCRGNGIRSGLGVCLARLVELLFCCLGPSLPAHIPAAGPMNKLTSSLKKTMKIWHVLWARSLDGSYQLATQSCARAAASLAKVSASQIHQWPELRAMSKALLWQLRLSGKTPLDAVSADMLQKSVPDTAAVLVGSTVPFAFLPRPSSATLQHCVEFTWHCREQTFMSQRVPDKEHDQSLSRYLRSLISSFEIMAGAGAGDNITAIMGQRVRDLVCALIHNPGCAAEHIHTRVADMWKFLKGVAASQGTNNKGKQHQLRMQRDEDDDDEEQQVQAKQAPDGVADMLGGVRLRWQTKELAAELLQQVIYEYHPQLKANQSNLYLKTFCTTTTNPMPSVISHKNFPYLTCINHQLHSSPAHPCLEQVLRESALIASRPGADSGMRAHFDLALARESEGKHFLVLKLEEMLNIALALRGTQIGGQSLPPLEVE